MFYGMLGTVLQQSFGNLLYLFLKVDTDRTYPFPPPLGTEAERELFEKMAQGDKEARDELICHNLRLVSHIVKKYYGNAPNQDDLISIGTVGLIKAIDSFHPENGTRFATYAGKCLQNEILMHFRAGKKRGCEVSVNEIIDTDKDGNALTYLDILPADEDIADTIGARIESEGARRLVEILLGEREKTIMILRYGLDGNTPLTQRETAARLNISRSYVSRIEKGALQKIRRGMKGGIV